MKLAIVVNPKEHKLKDETYSWCYRAQFDALINKFKPQLIHRSCDVSELDADVVLFYDLHSSFHVDITGLKQSKKLIIEYFNDPHQEYTKGFYRDGTEILKLGRKARLERARERGAKYIISPYRDAFYKFFGDHLKSEKLWWFPIAPQASLYKEGSKKLNSRRFCVLGSGFYRSDMVNKIYEFRKWAFAQPYIAFTGHYLFNSDLPKGKEYGQFLSCYAGALATNDYFPAPKFMEIPLAGCVTFAQHHPEYEELGFKDNFNCIYIDRNNLEFKVKSFLNNPYYYQHIADKGRELVLNNYTSEHFANWLEDKIKCHI